MIDDFVEANSDNPQVTDLVIWTVGALQDLTELGAVGGGGYKLSDTGEVRYQLIKNSFKATDAELAEAVVCMCDEEDHESLIYLLIGWRDDKETLIDLAEQFDRKESESDRYRWN